MRAALWEVLPRRCWVSSELRVLFVRMVGFVWRCRFALAPTKDGIGHEEGASASWDLHAFVYEVS